MPVYVNVIFNVAHVATRQVSGPLQQKLALPGGSVSLAGCGDEVGCATCLPEREYEDVSARFPGGCHHAESAVLLQHKNDDLGGTHQLPVLKVHVLMCFTDRE